MISFLAEDLTLAVAVLFLVTAMIVHAYWRPILRFFGWRNPGQRQRERAARRVFKKISKVDGFGRKLAYLRAIDPFTFEELVLEGFSRRGFKVQRNDRYTGDGGIDGRVWIANELFLVQAKRYRKHINAGHVRDFCRLVEQSGCRGLFVHTGITGGGARSVARGDERVTIISGQWLLDLLDPTIQFDTRTARAIRGSVAA